MIMKKHLFFAIALAGLTLAGCSSDDFIAETPPVNPTEDAPILFNSYKGQLTRANNITGAAAAELLGNKFVVSGKKGAKTNPAENIVSVPWTEKGDFYAAENDRQNEPPCCKRLHQPVPVRSSVP